MRTTLEIRSIIKVLGHLVLIEALMMLVPLIICLIYDENDWKCFAWAIAAASLAGGIVSLATRQVNTTIHRREGFILTAIIWVVFGIFGMIPFMTSDSPLSATDAMFETISGFTTTGASVIPDVEQQSHGILFWRALTQWIGGLGIILFMLAVIPEFNKSVGISMFNAEATGITHDKLHPRIRQTALSLWGIYMIISVISSILLWAGPMNLFDSVCQTFAAIATGGFSTHNQGISYWDSNYVMAVLSLVMFVAGLNFVLLYAIYRNGIRKLYDNDVAKTFSVIVLTSFLLLVFSAILRGDDFNIRNYLFNPLFHVISAITSTGFSINEAEGWGPFSLFLTIMLMLCGACAGSTSGGIKVDRFIVMGKNLINEVKKTVFPKRIYVVNLNGSFLQNSLVSRVSAFMTIYIFAVMTATAVITLFGYSFTDSIFMVSSCIGCNGLGFGATGVEGSYAFLPAVVKWLLVFMMLVGRLELFTFMVLLLPSFWKK